MLYSDDTPTTFQNAPEKLRNLGDALLGEGRLEQLASQKERQKPYELTAVNLVAEYKQAQAQAPKQAGDIAYGLNIPR